MNGADVEDEEILMSRYVYCTYITQNVGKIRGLFHGISLPVALFFPVSPFNFSPFSFFS